jgi:aminopeptidase N
MSSEAPALTRLVDYRPPAFLIDETELEFRLDPTATRVRARLQVRRNGAHGQPLVLTGEGLRTIAIRIDGEDRPDAEEGAGTLTIAEVPDAFVLETEVEIDPAGNSALEGLYMSGGRFCTQCEAEGFRRITWFLDRPDVLSRYTVRIEADAAFPRLLSNGNLLEAGDLGDGRHYAVWRDPFPKPSYLFALVAGELDVLEDAFTTASGRVVRLQIFVDTGMAPRAAYAMDALKRSMAWDEQAYGREYDLDLFMIVAVRDFNMGAMENKGLNIFNASLVLADPATATDFDYERIESVVAHEYFHNWTGNRITCRDWFQLCLKEGLTVYRDQSFSADQRGAAVQRIKDVRLLRARQFAEDAGPLAHPVRPGAYAKIDNFYTATIYEKGAEIIRMLPALIGEEAFRRGMDLYFDRWDGTATTVEAFVACFAEASGKDLTTFFAWYQQAGTPRVTQKARFADGALELTFSQAHAPSPGQPEKHPVPVPIRLALFDPDGAAPTVNETLVLEQATQTWRFENLPVRPVVSALGGFSAPVVLESDNSRADRLHQLARDPDLFNRWEAGQSLARELILARAGGAPDEAGETALAQALARSLADQSAEPAFKALLLAPPAENDLALACAKDADPAALHAARDALCGHIARTLEEDLARAHFGLSDSAAFSPDAESAGRRALRNAVADLLARLPQHRDLVVGHFETAANMTDAMGGLNALLHVGGASLDRALDAFYQSWRHEPLVVDKWFGVQARDPSPGALGRVMGLTIHPAFEGRTPNRIRSLVQAFSVANPARFHDPEGGGYAFLADQILTIDAFNPNLAANLVSPLADWRRYKSVYGDGMRAALERLRAARLSDNVLELVDRALR